MLISEDAPIPALNRGEMLVRGHAVGVNPATGTCAATQVRSSGAQLEEFGRLLSDGTISVAIDSSFPLSDVRKAQERAAEGHIQGKIVLVVAASNGGRPMIRSNLMSARHSKQSPSVP